MAISGYQFIRKIKQAINIRYASIRIIINFIKNIRINILRIMHPFKERQLLKRLLIKIISETSSHESRTWDIVFSHI
jgi:hypothetical protein